MNDMKIQKSETKEHLRDIVILLSLIDSLFPDTKQFKHHLNELPINIVSKYNAILKRYQTYSRNAIAITSTEENVESEENLYSSPDTIF